MPNVGLGITFAELGTMETVVSNIGCSFLAEICTVGAVDLQLHVARNGHFHLVIIVLILYQ